MRRKFLLVLLVGATLFGFLLFFSGGVLLILHFNAAGSREVRLAGWRAMNVGGLGVVCGATVWMLGVRQIAHIW